MGGSGVGSHLLERVLAAEPAARRLVPGLRMVAVCGPRIDPAALAAGDVELHGYVDGLHRWLDACDIGVVQGGLTTTMELVAARRPFLYFPLERHFEQQLHVAHRLERHGAGRRMEYASASSVDIARGDRGGARPHGQLPDGSRGRRKARSRAHRAACRSHVRGRAAVPTFRTPET